MSSKKKNLIIGISLILVLVIIVIVLLLSSDEKKSKKDNKSESQSNITPTTSLTKKELEEDWDTTGATIITLDGTTASMSGTGAVINDGNLIINSEGKYVIYGNLTNGYISVNTTKEAEVWIMLKDASINCNDNAAFRVEQAKKVYLTIAKGSSNTFTSGEAYSQEAIDGKTDGVIFSSDDLIINGAGKLTITGGIKHGIVVNDDLVLSGGEIDITALKDAIHVKKSIVINNTTINAKAQDDGIVVTKKTGILTVESGDITIAASDDGINVGSDVIINNGTINISTGNDAIHATNSFTINNGCVNIEKCTEGIEATVVTMNGGDVNIITNDDGINASKKTSDEDEDSSDEDKAEAVNLTPIVTINGGKLLINNSEGRDADGIDSNGNIVINGGEVIISVNGTGTNCALDCNSEQGYELLINGGIVVAAGGSKMLERPSNSSKQASITYTLNSFANDGSSIVLKSDKELINYTVPNGFSSVTISCPELSVGNSYTLNVGNETDTISLTELVYSNSSSPFGDKPNKPFGERDFEDKDFDHKNFGDKDFNDKDFDNKDFGDKDFNDKDFDNEDFGDRPPRNDKFRGELEPQS